MQITYNPTNWINHIETVDGTVIVQGTLVEADIMNNIEQGIVNLTKRINEWGTMGGGIESILASLSHDVGLLIFTQSFENASLNQGMKTIFVDEISSADDITINKGMYENGKVLI